MKRALRVFPLVSFVAANAWAEAPKPAPKPAPAPQKKAAPSPVSASRLWHQKPAGKSAPVDDKGKPKLALQGLNIPDHIELVARNERGGFSAEDLDRAAHVMRDHGGNEHPIHPHLLDLVYRVQVHFAAHEIRIISGYRAPRNNAQRSNHGKGRAIDLVVPGASDEEVAKFARDQGFVGVGVYPVSGFVHLDVRERSFFWVDTSGPGKRSRLRGVLADIATKSDKEAAARGERSVGPFFVGTDVDAAIGSTAIAQQEDDDDDNDATM